VGASLRKSVVSGHDIIYLIEVKCYEFFAEGSFLDEKVEEVLQKLKDTVFFLLFCRLEKENLKTQKIRFLDAIQKSSSVNFEVLICPPCHQQQRIGRDGVMSLIEVLRKRIKSFEKFKNIRCFVKYYEDEVELFSGILPKAQHS